MKKICFVLSGIEYSGAEIVLERMLKGNGFIDPYFILIFKNSEIENKLKNIYGHNKVYFLDNKYNKIKYSLTIPYLITKVEKEIKEYICKINPDMVYVNNTREGMLCSKAAEKNRGKWVVHIHDMYESTNNPYAKLTIKKYLEKYNTKITVSNATKESWKLNNMIVVYNGLDEKYFNFNQKDGVIKNIAFVGSLTKRKGADKLIGAIESIYNDLKLNITIVYKYYEEDLKTNLNNVILKLNGGNNNSIRILENLSPNEISDLYKEVDLLIVPSIRDPLPTVIMEAQANGVIVIGNNIDGIPEMIYNKELVCNLDSSEDILKSIEKVLKNDEETIKKYRENAYNYSRENFSIVNSRKKITEIIGE